MMSWGQLAAFWIINACSLDVVSVRNMSRIGFKMNRHKACFIDTLHGLTTCLHIKSMGINTRRGISFTYNSIVAFMFTQGCESVKSGL